MFRDAPACMLCVIGHVPIDTMRMARMRIQDLKMTGMQVRRSIEGYAYYIYDAHELDYCFEVKHVEKDHGHYEYGGGVCLSYTH